jgi:ribonuclease HII
MVIYSQPGAMDELHMATQSPDAATEAALRADPRPGAAALLQAIARRRFENRAEGQRLRRLTRLEWALWDKGILHVAGVDEAGLSPLAGPVSAAAVIFLPVRVFPALTIRRS